MVVVMALGGSTNAVLHLIAMARAVGRAADDRRLPEGQRPRAVPGRPEAQRQVRAGRPAQRRRHAGRDEVPAGKGPARRRLPDRHRQDAGREPARPARPQARGRTSFTRSKTRSSRPGTSRFSRGNLAPEGAVAKITGKEGDCVSAARPRSSTPKRTCCTRWSARRSPRATWSSSATKAPRADPACPRCSRRPRPSWAPAWATTWP